MLRVVTWLKSSVSNVGQTLTMRQPFVSHKPHQELLPGISKHFNRKHLGFKKIFKLTVIVSNILFSNYWHQKLIWAFGNVPDKVGFQPFRYFWLFAVPQVIVPFASHKSNQNPLSIIPIWVLIGNKGTCSLQRSPKSLILCHVADLSLNWFFIANIIFIRQRRIPFRSRFSQEYTFLLSTWRDLTDFQNARTCAHL